MDMIVEQQLDPKVPEKGLWLNQEEDEEEEEAGVDLLARHASSRHPPNGVEATATRPSPSAQLEPANGTTTQNSEPEEQKEDEPVTSCGGDQNQEVVVENGEAGGHTVYFDKLEGTESISETYEMQSEVTNIPSMDINHQKVKIMEDEKVFSLSPAPVEHFHEEANGSSNHFQNETEVDDNVDSIAEIEDLVDLDVEGVIEKQNTHDLYCPNCNSCITKRVILVRRRRAKVSIRHKPKRGSKLDPIPDSACFGGSDDTPEILSDVSPAAATDTQINSREQEQEAFSCLSCFSLFIPLGNGCFKIFEFFTRGRQTEHAQSSQEMRQGENTQSPPEIIRQRGDTESRHGINTIEITQSPQEMRPDGKTQNPQGIISQNGNAETLIQVSHDDDMQRPQKISSDANMSSPQGIISQNGNAETLIQVSHDDDMQRPQKISSDANMSSTQHINQNEDAQKPQALSVNEDTKSPQKISRNENAPSSQDIKQNESKQSPQKISRNENAPSSQDIKQNESKQSPQKIPRDRKKWIFSIFSSRESKETVEREYSDVQAGGHTTIVQSASVSTSSVINKEYLNGAAINTKEPGTSDNSSSTNSSLLDKLKAQSAEQKPDASMFQRDVVENEINDIETGLLEPLLPPNTEVAPSSQTRTETEHRGAGSGEVREWEILKSIVYGGLIESITSLGVVSSAAGAGADTLIILALGVANLIGGLILICHNLRDLKNDQYRGASDVEEDRYQALLGRRQNFAWHATFAILSFLVFGLVPPVVYGFSFRKSDDKDLKLAAVAGASLICIILLALGKGHIRKPRRTYFRTLSYYVTLGITASGISYVVGQLIKRLLVQLGLSESNSTVSMPFSEMVPMMAGQASY